MLTVNAFSFGLTGLTINYTIKGETTNWVLDPCATCQIFEDLGIIEGFIPDTRTSEPVILWQDRQYDRPVIEHCPWNDFTSTFPFVQRQAEIIVEAKENYRIWKEDEALIQYLLSPLTAA